MKIVITIDERGNPKVEIEKEENSREFKQVKELEIASKKVIERANTEVNPEAETITYERCELWSKLLPVYVHVGTGAYKIWKFLKTAGLVKSKQDFIDCYNAGGICIGQKNRYEVVTGDALDLNLFFGDVVGNDRRDAGYLPIRYKTTNILVKIIRSRKGLR